MDNKPAQNIQDSFLNTARKEKMQITIYLLSGVKLTGRIRSFDKYSVVLETNNQEQLIFKHAISTVVMSKSGHHAEGRPQPVVETENHYTQDGGLVYFWETFPACARVGWDRNRPWTAGTRISRSGGVPPSLPLR